MFFVCQHKAGPTTVEAVQALMTADVLFIFVGIIERRNRTIYNCNVVYCTVHQFSYCYSGIEGACTTCLNLLYCTVLYRSPAVIQVINAACLFRRCFETPPPPPPRGYGRSGRYGGTNCGHLALTGYRSINSEIGGAGSLQGENAGRDFKGARALPRVFGHLNLMCAFSGSPACDCAKHDTPKN